MAWLSRVNFTASDVLSYSDVNNLGNDIRAWGGNVNGGGYTLSNVILSASSGTMATVIGGTGTTSTLTFRSTSGVGTTGADIIFQTGNNGATEVMRLQNGGNVGIGTSSPSSLGKLAVVGNIVASGGGTIDPEFRLTAPSGGTTRTYAMGVDSAAKLYWYDYTAAQYRMVIDSSGNVGIGTSSPSTYGLLTVSGGSAAISPVLTIESTAFNSGQGCALAFARNGFTQPIQARIRTADNGASASNLLFETKADGTAGALSERMRIDSSGNVLIGTTSVSGILTVSGSGTSTIFSALHTGSNGSFKLNGTGATSAEIVADIGVFKVTGFGNTAIYADTYGNKVGIGTSSVATSAKLEIAGTTGALLVPRLTTTERNALTAVNGMIIYNTTDNQMQGRINGAWVAM